MENPNFSHTAAFIAPLSRDGVQQYRRDASAYLKGRNGLLLIAASLGIVGLITAWTWFGTAAVLPVLYILPCAAMVAMCMRGHGGSGNAPAKPDSSAGSAPDIRQGISE